MIFIIFCAATSPYCSLAQKNDSLLNKKNSAVDTVKKTVAKFYLEGGVVVIGDGGPWKLGLHTWWGDNILDIVFLTGMSGSVCANTSGSYLLFIPIGSSSGCLPTYEHYEFYAGYSRVLLKGKSGWISLSVGTSVINMIDRSAYDCVDSLTGLPPFTGTYSSHCKIATTSITYIAIPISTSFNWKIGDHWGFVVEGALRISERSIKPSLSLSLILGSLPGS